MPYIAVINSLGILLQKIEQLSAQLTRVNTSPNMVSEIFNLVAHNCYKLVNLFNAL